MFTVPLFILMFVSITSRFAILLSIFGTRTVVQFLMVMCHHSISDASKTKQTAMKCVHLLRVDFINHSTYKILC
ncbi:membrane-associated protein, putative [Bodo saltans]|uniref:Membrane-associated protein, putative n=1 Tax=Bodo saltans TaxID=75058 RepID=A0A0S4IU57_BODSA|nr:membrane-associated protein, putative [Bodo saltans]|eukprot:CUF22220.1 membrane-associated protein, putative [Bodo saltans]